MADNKFYFRTLIPKDLSQMYFTFLDAFADYPVNFKLTKEQFVRKFVEKLKIDFGLSVGAFDYDALTGFIFTTVNYYDNHLTAYNGGTGVRPSSRGHRLTRMMYDFLLPRLMEKGINQCILEVLTHNAAAVKVYEEIGFQKIDILNSYRSPKDFKKRKILNSDLQIRQVYQPNWEEYMLFQDYRPSFLDTEYMITENIAHEEFLEARVNGELAGYVIYQPVFARLSQIAVHPKYRRIGVASELIAHLIAKSPTKELNIVNVREKDSATDRFLTSMGFKLYLSQYEMLLPLLEK